MVAILVTVAIILILVVVFLTGGLGGANTSVKAKDEPGKRKDGHGITVPGKVMFAAKDEVCKSNLDQVRQGIALVHNTSPDSEYPATIEDTRLGQSLYACPIGKEKYEYDPAKGTVKCPHKGHENY